MIAIIIGFAVFWAFGFLAILISFLYLVFSTAGETEDDEKMVKNMTDTGIFPSSTPMNKLSSNNSAAWLGAKQDEYQEMKRHEDREPRAQGQDTG